MIKIDPNCFYTRQELIDMFDGMIIWDDLCGRLNIRKVIKNGYWGAHIIEAINAAGVAHERNTSMMPVLKGTSEQKPSDRVQARRARSYGIADAAMDELGVGRKKRSEKQ